MKTTVISIRSTSSPALSATLPPAACVSLVRNGDPAAVPNKITPISSGRFNGRTWATAKARSGTSAKLATSAEAINRALRSWSMICRTVKPKPTESILVTTKT
jgi:hypothetical protein